ncbi:hypothetical protein KIH39_22105 [Telmatocola sphagniphila]|uniref:Uncharacterized protein n=1 Tax=Telmatocola sphagniphila TaxID=1123043 RepID=A0A8E6B430_9BACT|nr:hypothetical protein [Telmatocola sphagniphila]QVL31512.1 hypothetical protein KIH39_22105 [Telmatocola sphagniphila]
MIISKTNNSVEIKNSKYIIFFRYLILFLFALIAFFISGLIIFLMHPASQTFAIVTAVIILKILCVFVSSIPLLVFLTFFVNADEYRFTKHNVIKIYFYGLVRIEYSFSNLILDKNNGRMIFGSAYEYITLRTDKEKVVLTGQIEQLSSELIDVLNSFPE